MDAESERGLNEQAKSPIKHGAKSPDKGEGKRNANSATEKRASGCDSRCNTITLEARRHITFRKLTSNNLTSNNNTGKTHDSDLMVNF